MVQDLSYTHAMEYIQAKAQGKNSAALYNDPRAQELVDKILNENKDLRKAYFAGQSARIAAKEAGFSSVEEYQSLSGFAKKDQMMVQQKEQAPVQEEFTGQKYREGYTPTGSILDVSKYTTAYSNYLKRQKGTGTITPEQREALRSQASNIRANQGLFESAYRDINEAITRRYQANVVRSDNQIETKGGADYGEVSEVSEPKGLLERAEFNIEKYRSQLQTESLRDEDKGAISSISREAKSFGLGVASAVVGVGLFAKSLVTNPLKTTKEVGSSIYSTGERVVSGEGFPEVGKIIREEPGYATGLVVGDIAVDIGITKATSLVKKGYGFIRTSTGKYIIQEIPTPELESAIQPFTRQRSTVLLKESDSGKYILGVTDEGIAISIGGGIEKGQTARKAALTELYQETGLKLKDISDFKSAGKVIFPEETHYLFTAEVSDITKVKASSDINRIIKVSPKKALGITGQTKFSPVSKTIFSPSIVDGKLTLFENIRSYELGLIGKVEFGQTPTWLSVTTKQGKFYLGTQSRYNVPFSSQSQYLKEDVLMLAHGTQDAKTIQRFYSSRSKEFKIDLSKSARGAEKGLYVQPPVSSKLDEGYFGLSYAGIGQPSKSEGIGFSFRRPKRAFYTFDETPSYPIVPTPKTFAGAESELIIKQGTIRSIGSSEKVFIEGKKLFIQQAEIVKTQKIGLNLKDSYANFFKAEYQSSIRYVTASDILTQSYLSIGALSKSSKGFLSSQLSSIKKYFSYELTPYESKFSPRSEPRIMPESYYSNFIISAEVSRGLSISESDYFKDFPLSVSSSPIIKNLGNGFAGFNNLFNNFLPFKQSGKSKPQLFPQPKKYQPTLLAAAFEIKAPKISKAYKAGAGALTLRPIINSRRKR